MFDTVCTLPLASDLFSLAIHPSAPIIATGLATGHVSTQRLPSTAADEDASILSSNSDGRGHIATLWRTRRHALSCRTLAFSPDGESLFSAGADGLVKCAPTETGQVVDKIRVPGPDAPCLLHPLTGRTLLLATDDGALHLYDLRESERGFAARRPASTLRPHADYVASITPLAPTAQSTSGLPKQWVSTGGTTLAVSDLRRGVLVRSEDQEEALLSSVAVDGLARGGTSVGEKILVGGAGGVLTLWERGQWDDQDERIVVDKGYGGGGESLDVLAALPEGVGEGKTVAVGMGDGRVRFVRLGMNKVVGQVRHDDVEGVVGIGFDVEGRMVTGGGSTVKVWHEKVDEDFGAYVEEGKRPGMKFSIYDDDEEEAKEPTAVRDESDDEDAGGRKKKKRKGNSGGHLNGTAGDFSFAGLD